MSVRWRHEHKAQPTRSRDKVDEEDAEVEVVIVVVIGVEDVVEEDNRDNLEGLNLLVVHSALPSEVRVSLHS